MIIDLELFHSHNIGPFIQEGSGVYTSLFLETDDWPKMFPGLSRNVPQKFQFQISNSGMYFLFNHILNS